MKIQTGLVLVSLLCGSQFAGAQTTPCTDQVNAAAQAEITKQESQPWSNTKSTNCRFNISNGMVSANCDQVMGTGPSFKGGYFFNYKVSSECEVTILPPRPLG